MPPPSGTPSLPHTECVEACRHALLQAADQHLATADRLYARRATRGNARVNRRRAVAYAWAAGRLRQLLEARR